MIFRVAGAGQPGVIVSVMFRFVCERDSFCSTSISVRQAIMRSHLSNEVFSILVLCKLHCKVGMA